MNYGSMSFIKNIRRGSFLTYNGDSRTYLREENVMTGLKDLFEYQKFNPDESLERCIEIVESKYFSGFCEIKDEDLDVAAAGNPFPEKEDADKK